MKRIKIIAVIDVIQALASDSLSGSVYFLDNNKVNGSTSEGTESLQTAVTKGDELVWMSQTMEVEVFAGIERVIIDKDVCIPKKKSFEGTDITYWTGVVKKAPKDPVPYSVEFKLGTREETMSTSSEAGPSIISSST